MSLINHCKVFMFRMEIKQTLSDMLQLNMISCSKFKLDELMLI